PTSGAALLRSGQADIPRRQCLATRKRAAVRSRPRSRTNGVKKAPALAAGALLLARLAGVLEVPVQARAHDVALLFDAYRNYHRVLMFGAEIKVEVFHLHRPFRCNHPLDASPCSPSAPCLAAAEGGKSPRTTILTSLHVAPSKAGSAVEEPIGLCQES